MALLLAHKWISYGLSETFAHCLWPDCVAVCACVCVCTKSMQWTKANPNGQWMTEQRINLPGKKWQIIVSLGLPSEFLTGVQGLWQMLMGDCKSALTIYKEKLAHYANSCIILPRHLLILRSASAINFIRYSLRLYKDSDLQAPCRVQEKFSHVMWNAPSHQCI